MGLRLRQRCDCARPRTFSKVRFAVVRVACVMPVEVQAKRGATALLNKFLERTDVRVGYKLSSGYIGVTEKKVTLPLYMARYLG